MKSLEPQRRLPVSPVTPPRRSVLSRLRPRAAGFPFAAPTWPGGVAYEPEQPDTGMDYDTEWARRWGVRVARAVVVDNVTRPLVHALASPTVSGADRLGDVDGPAIFAANHASHVDTPLLLATLPDRYRHKTVVAAGADYFFDKRWKAGLWAFSINAIPIERFRISRRSADLPARLLKEGWSLLIYPEGGRTPDGWGVEHRGGAAYLALRTGAPVVPIYVEGTRRVFKKGARLPRLGTTAVVYGAPLRPREGEDSRRFAARVERAVAALADEHRSDWWTARRRAAAGTTPTLQGPDVPAWRRSWLLGEGRRRPRSGPRWPAR